MLKTCFRVCIVSKTVLRPVRTLLLLFSGFSVRIRSVVNRSNRDTTVYYGLIFCAFSWPYLVKWHNSGIIKRGIQSFLMYTQRYPTKNREHSRTFSFSNSDSWLLIAWHTTLARMRLPLFWTMKSFIDWNSLKYVRIRYFHNRTIVEEISRRGTKVTAIKYRKTSWTKCQLIRFLMVLLLCKLKI